MSEELVEVVLPKLGESILGATVVQWLKKEGEWVAVDEPLLEVSTDKVNSEIPSPFAGVLQAQLVGEQEEVEIGAPLARIALQSQKPSQESGHRPHAEVSSSCEESSFSPVVLRIAAAEGISLETLRALPGTGEGGRITKRDLEAYLQEKRTDAPTEEERIPLSGMRKKIAENMVRSFYEAPHASLVCEADVTEIVAYLAQEKLHFQERHGAKLTITSFLIHALVRALADFPLLNASLEKETIIVKHAIHVGFAVNLDKGLGLMVPVIKGCHQRDLVSIAQAVGDLSQRARAGTLLPDETAGGTITLTNFGMKGALLGVPIIRHPEVAILGAGAIQKRPVVGEGDQLHIRDLLYLTLTFDHRVINGVYGCDFLSALCSHLHV